MSTEEKEIVLRTEEVNEILTATPKWILRWGITVVFLLIVIGIILSHFIKYPDVLIADVTITTLNPPVTLIAKSNGKLINLLINDKQTIQSGEVIGVIENTANYLNVLELYKLTNKISQQLKLSDTINKIQINDTLNTGELTPFYLQTLKVVKDFNLYNEINSNQKQINFLKVDLLNYKSLLSKYQQQQKISNEQLKLAEIDFSRDKKLFEEKAISAREFENQKKAYLNALNSNEQSKIATSNVLIQINSIEKNILQLKIQAYQEKAKLNTDVLQSLKILIAEIEKWKLVYLIESPIDGKLSYFSLWKVNQNIQQGDELFAIIPRQKQLYLGKCNLSTANSGKLSKGQKVNIKLENYPYNENGMLSGVVQNVSEVPNKDSYLLDLEMPNGLKTSYNKTLIYKQQMKGKAEIITKDISVFDRIFFNFKKLLDKR